ncbi:TetR/AcrR family transcriptional regulator C-terminal domain-containing protein [Rhizobium sp. YIM 134829]|uniref:TetR/AcrR family transcriptional regulator C-terminal domain-containing protein n=1 Tax=Rhizobium sp. YIM 134829 TaxID=3390453 RepID=UPI00397B6DF9
MPNPYIAASADRAAMTVRVILRNSVVLLLNANAIKENIRLNVPVRNIAFLIYELGPGQTHNNLTAMIEAAMVQGELAVPSASEAAEQLIGMWQGLANYRLPLGVGVEGVIAGIEARVTSAVDLFVTAYQSSERA